MWELSEGLYHQNSLLNTEVLIAGIMLKCKNVYSQME